MKTKNGQKDLKALTKKAWYSHNLCCILYDISMHIFAIKRH